MSQIVSSLPNKFEQGIFAALCFDFSLSKNLVIYIVPLQADHFILLFPCDWECKGKTFFYSCNYFFKNF
jgi:hypothetical protein